MKKIINEDIYIIKLTEDSWLGDDDMEYVEVYDVTAAERHIGYEKAKEVFDDVENVLAGDYDNMELQQIGFDVKILDNYAKKIKELTEELQHYTQEYIRLTKDQ